jgi:hypothetical protein
MTILLVTVAMAGESTLWGADGEAWDPRGRLPDFSYAGYRANLAEIPDAPEVASVLDFGALPDDDVDDTAALVAALAATSGGALVVPPGTYVVSDVVTLDHGDVVLRGAGSTQTIFDVTRSLTDVRGAAPQWSWSGGFLWVEGPNPVGAAIGPVGPAVRGDTTLTLTGDVAAGDVVVLRLVDDAERSLGWHLHNDQLPPGDCEYQVPLVLEWPVEVAAVEGEVLTLAQPLRFDVRPEWSPTLHRYEGLSEIGVEGIGFRFPDVPYAGHLLEPGYNGVTMRGVRDAWIRDVAFENADNGVLIDEASKRITVAGVALTGREGHHGVQVAFAADTRFEDLDYAAEFVHHITVDHRANGNVFRRVRAPFEVALDHHRDSPFENLFTAFEAEVSWLHGGNLCAGPPAGARETIWGIPGPFLPPYWSATQANIIGELTLDDRLDPDGAWYENVEDLAPFDLFEAQRARRLDPPGEDTAPDDTDDTAPPDPTPPPCGCVTARPTPIVGLLAVLLVRRRRRAQPPQS